MPYLADYINSKARHRENIRVDFTLNASDCAAMGTMRKRKCYDVFGSCITILYGNSSSSFLPGRLSLSLSLLAVVPGYSQLLSFGVRAGVPLSDAYSDANFGDGAESSHLNNRYIVGPTAEIHFPLRLSFQADVLYCHSGYHTTGSVLPGGATVNDWQVPLLAKFDLSRGPATPFIDGGLAYRHLSRNLNNPAGQVFVGVNNSNSAGITLGAGLQFKTPPHSSQP